MASIVCPAKGKPAGVGSASTSISASTAPTRPSRLERLPEGAAGVALGALEDMEQLRFVKAREQSAEGHFSEMRADPKCCALPGARADASQERGAVRPRHGVRRRAVPAGGR